MQYMHKSACYSNLWNFDQCIW